MLKLIPLLALSLLCLTAKPQCPGLTVSGDTTKCNTEYTTLKAEGASHYFWSTNGANKHQDSTVSFFRYPYTWSGAVTLTAMCNSNTYTRVIQIQYTYCTAINENEPNNQVQPVYYDLTGNKAEPVQGQVLIEQRGIYRRKVLIQ